MAPELWSAPQAWAAVEASEWPELSLKEGKGKEGITTREASQQGPQGSGGPIT